MLQLSYMIKWLVFIGLLMFKKFIQALRFKDFFRLVREQHCISIKGHSQLRLQHLRCFLWFEDGGCRNPFVTIRDEISVTTIFSDGKSKFLVSILTFL